MERSQTKRPTDLRDHFRRDAIQPQAGPSRAGSTRPSRGTSIARGRLIGAGSSKENPIELTSDDDDVGSGFGSATNVTSGNSSMTDVRSGREVDRGRKGVESRNQSVSASGVSIGQSGYVGKTQRVVLASGDAAASARTRKLGDEIRRLASVEPSSNTQPVSTALRGSSREARRDISSHSVPASAPRRQATVGPAPLASSSRSVAAASAAASTPFASSSGVNSTIPRASASISPQKAYSSRSTIIPSTHRVDPRRLSRGERADDPIEIESTDSERIMRTIDVTESLARTSLVNLKRGLPSPGEPLRSPSRPRGIFGSHGKEPQDRHLPTLALRRTSTISSEGDHHVPPPTKKGRQAVPGGPEAIRAARSLSQQRESSSSIITITSSGRGSGQIGGTTQPSSELSSIGAVSLIASHEPNSEAGPSRTPNRRMPAPFPLGPAPSGRHNAIRHDTTPRAVRNLHSSTPTRTIHPSTSPTTPRIPITPSKPVATPTRHSLSNPRQTYLSPRAPTHLLISPPKRKRSAEDLDADFHPVHLYKRAERSTPSRRPTRTRPAPGTYAVPQMDAPDDEWRAKPTQVVRPGSRPDHGSIEQEETALTAIGAAPLTPIGAPTLRADRTGVDGQVASASGQALSSSASHIGTPKHAVRRMTSPLSPLPSQESPGRILSQRGSQLEPVQEEVSELRDEPDLLPISQGIPDQADEQREEREPTEVEEEPQDGGNKSEGYDVVSLTSYSIFLQVSHPRTARGVCRLCIHGDTDQTCLRSRSIPTPTIPHLDPFGAHFAFSTHKSANPLSVQDPPHPEPIQARSLAVALPYGVATGLAPRWQIDHISRHSQLARDTSHPAVSRWTISASAISGCLVVGTGRWSASFGCRTSWFRDSGRDRRRCGQLHCLVARQGRGAPQSPARGDCEDIRSKEEEVGSGRRG